MVKNVKYLYLGISILIIALFVSIYALFSTKRSTDKNGKML